MRQGRATTQEKEREREARLPLKTQPKTESTDPGRPGHQSQTWRKEGIEASITVVTALFDILPCESALVFRPRVQRKSGSRPNREKNYCTTTIATIAFGAMCLILFCHSLLASIS